MSKFDSAKKRSLRKGNKMPAVTIGTYYQVPVLALPLFPFVYCWDKYIEWSYNRRTWSEKKATKVLDKVLPKCLEWVEEDNAYYYCMEWPTNQLWENAGIHRKWALKFSGKLKNFIEEGYENKNYTKTIEPPCDETWVKFVEK